MLKTSTARWHLQFPTVALDVTNFTALLAGGAKTNKDHAPGHNRARNKRQEP